MAECHRSCRLDWQRLALRRGNRREREMPTHAVDVAFERINLRHVRLLGMLADGLTEAEVAVRLDLSTSVVKSTVERLKTIADVGSTRELRSWWVKNRARFLDYAEEAAGLRA